MGVRAAEAGLTGRLEQGGWWQLRAADIQKPCWIAESVVEPYGDLSGVQFVIPPSLPTPTPTDEPVSPEQGCWVYNANLKRNVCTIPCPPNPNPGGSCTP